MQFNSVSSGLSLALILLANGGPDASAQEPDDDAATAVAAEGQGRLETVIVTAQKREERLQDVPIAVTAIDAQALEDFGVTDNLELGQVVPGLQTREGSGFYVPYIRGIGSRAITPGNESPVAFYVDGVYQSGKANLLLSGFSDVEAIRVLRGPQGTLFGRNATAGAILVETKEPGNEFELDAKLTYGSDESSGTAFVGGPVSSTLRSSVSVFVRNEDDYIRNLNPTNGAGDEVGSTEAWGVRAKLLWDPTATFSALLQADYVDSEDEAPWAPQAIEGTGLTAAEAVSQAQGVDIPDIRHQRPVYAGEAPPLVSTTGEGVYLTLDWALESVDVKSITAWRSDSSSGNLDLDGSPLPLFYFITDLESDVWQQEINISSDTEGPFNWQLGAYLLDLEDGYESLDQNIGIPFEYTPQLLATLPQGAVHLDAHSYVQIDSWALFGEAYYNLTESTKLTVGLRYTDEEHRLDPDNQQITVVPDGMGGIVQLPPATPQQSCDADPACDDLTALFEEFTWRLVVDHRFTEDALAYASYNRGFKSGVFNISTITNYQATDPEIIDTYELGLKSAFLDNRLSLNAAVYYSDYEDLQVSITEEGTNTQIQVNAASATTSGVEVEAQWLVTNNLFFSGAFSTFFEAEYDSFPSCGVYQATGAGNAQISGDCSGQGMPMTPDYTFHVFGEYAIPLASGAEVRLNGLYSYTDEFDYAPYSPNSTRPPLQNSIETLNLSATWSSPGDDYYVKLWGRNLLDPDDVFRGLFTTGLGFNTTFSRGATYGVTAGIRY